MPPQLKNNHLCCILIMFSIGRSSNGRTEAFEAFNLGSIPSLPARVFKNKTPEINQGF